MHANNIISNGLNKRKEIKKSNNTGKQRQKICYTHFFYYYYYYFKEGTEVVKVRL